MPWLCPGPMHCHDKKWCSAYLLTYLYYFLLVNSMPFRHHSFAISTNLFLKEVVRFYSSHEMLSDDMYFLNSKMLAGPCMDSWETTLLHLNWSMFKIGFFIWHQMKVKLWFSIKMLQIYTSNVSFFYVYYLSKIIQYSWISLL